MPNYTMPESGSKFTGGTGSVESARFGMHIPDGSLEDVKEAINLQEAAYFGSKLMVT